MTQDSWKIDSLVKSNFSLPSKNEKKLSNFAKPLFLVDKINQNTNFAKLPLAKCFLYYSRIEVFQNCSAALFCLSFSRERKMCGNERIYVLKNCGFWWKDLRSKQKTFLLNHERLKNCSCGFKLCFGQKIYNIHNRSLVH